MHVSSYQSMVNFFISHVKSGDKVLDVGSKVCGRDKHGYGFVLKKLSKVEYHGLDIEPGDNVDIVVADPYNWRELEDESFDIVISGQLLEHVEFFWILFKEMVRVLKPGGYMCVIAPKLQKQHRFPVDCWRFLPDGMGALAKWAGITCISAEARHFSYADKPEMPYDCVGVFQK